jgi:hypothetical protein
MAVMLLSFAVFEVFVWTYGIVRGEPMHFEGGTNFYGTEYTPITGKPLVKSIALLIKHSVLPCEKASFHLLSLHQNFSVITEIIFAILYYLCGVVLFTGIAYYFCRKKELDWK